MQNIFQLVELDNKVGEYFSAEKKEALEAILSSNVIKDILKMTTAKKINSPSKQLVSVAQSAQQSFDKNYWQRSSPVPKDFV
jgi:hypothetical protein